MGKIIKEKFRGITKEGKKITGDLEVGLSKDQDTPIINVKVKAKIE